MFGPFGKLFMNVRVKFALKKIAIFNLTHICKSSSCATKRKSAVC